MDEHTELVFPSKRGLFFYGCLTIFISLSILSLMLAYFSNGWLSMTGVFFALAFLFVVAVILLMGRYIRYVLGDDGIRIPNGSIIIGFDIQESIRYDSIIEVNETKNVAFSPVLSSDAIMIRYRKENGRIGSISLSPNDKERFMTELNERRIASKTDSNL